MEEVDEMETYKPTVSRRKLSKLETKNIFAWVMSLDGGRIEAVGWDVTL